MAPTLRIEAPRLTPIDFTIDAGWIVDALDLGTPAIRDEERAATDMDGVIDTTALHGARDILITGRVFATEQRSLWQQKQMLAAYGWPHVRLDVHVREHADAPALVARGCRPVQIPRRIVDRDDDEFRAVFRVPSGVIEAVTPTVTTIFPGHPDELGGIEFDFEFDFEFPAGTPPGGGVVVNAGATAAYPVLRIDGPCSTDNGVGVIAVESLTAGRRLVFRDLEILEGDYLEIDTRARTIRLNSLPEQSRQDRLDMSESSWWRLLPGANELRFLPEEFASPSRLTVTHFDPY